MSAGTVKTVFPGRRFLCGAWRTATRVLGTPSVSCLWMLIANLFSEFAVASISTYSGISVLVAPGALAALGPLRAAVGFPFPRATQSCTPRRHGPAGGADERAQERPNRTSQILAPTCTATRHCQAPAGKCGGLPFSRAMQTCTPGYRGPGGGSEAQTTAITRGRTRLLTL